MLTYLAVTMASGLALSRVAKKIHLPNVTAYLVAGLLIGPFVLRILPADTVESFSIITEVALGFIAFSIGGEFKLSHMRAIGSGPITITFFQALCATVTVIIGLLVLGTDLPTSLLLGAVATATAPAATLMVVRQYKAKGPVTDVLLPVVAMDDAVGLMVFSICAALAKGMVSGEALTVYSMAVKPLIEIVASLITGGLIGVALTLSARFFASRGNRLALVILAVFLGVGLSDSFGLSSLLVCMMTGAVVVNMNAEMGAALMERCDRFTPPLYLLFFVISGAELNLNVLPTVGIVGVAYILLRSIGKWVGASVGALIVKADKNIVKYLGPTLLPQAGVAIGMAQMALAIIPSHGAQVRAVVLAATLVYELIGPVITKIALTRAGEISPQAR